MIGAVSTDSPGIDFRKMERTDCGNEFSDSLQGGWTAVRLDTEQRLGREEVVTAYTHTESCRLVRGA